MKFYVTFGQQYARGAALHHNHLLHQNPGECTRIAFGDVRACIKLLAVVIG